MEKEAHTRVKVNSNQYVLSTRSILICSFIRTSSSTGVNNEHQHDKRWAIQYIIDAFSLCKN